MQPNTTYTFTFYACDIVNNLYSSAITTNVTTLQVPGYNRISAQLLSSGRVRLSFVGNAGASYALDRTLKLVPPNWQPQATNAADGSGVLVLTNTPAAGTNYFWRMRLVP
jgi:hypothetical protein